DAEHLHASRVGAQQPADQPDRRRLAGAVRADQAEHLAAIDRQRQLVDGDRRAVPFADLLERDDRFGHGYCWNGISASTGIPGLRTPALLSTATFTRYTSFERSSAVCTLRGVNSAFSAIIEMTPAIPAPPASVTTVTGWPTRS